MDSLKEERLWCSKPSAGVRKPPRSRRGSLKVPPRSRRGTKNAGLHRAKIEYQTRSILLHFWQVWAKWVFFPKNMALSLSLYWPITSCKKKQKQCKSKKVAKESVKNKFPQSDNFTTKFNFDGCAEPPEQSDDDMQEIRIQHSPECRAGWRPWSLEAIDPKVRAKQ